MAAQRFSTICPLPLSRPAGWGAAPPRRTLPPTSAAVNGRTCGALSRSKWIACGAFYAAGSAAGDAESPIAPDHGDREADNPADDKPGGGDDVERDANPFRRPLVSGDRESPDDQRCRGRRKYRIRRPSSQPQCTQTKTRPVGRHPSRTAGRDAPDGKTIIDGAGQNVADVARGPP